MLLCLLTGATPGQQTSNGNSAASRARGGEDRSGNDAAAVELLEKHIAAIGGREAWKAVKTIETRSETEAFGQTGKVYRLEEPATGRFYQVSETANGRIEFGFDGKRAWRKAPFFRGYLPDTDPQTKAATSKRPPLYEYREGKRRFERLPNETISGEELLVLKSTDADPLGREMTVKYYFDPTTFLLKQRTSGNEITQTSVFGDYRKTDGKVSPFSTITTSPQATIKIKVLSIKYDVPIDASKFEFRDDAAKPISPAATTPAPAARDERDEQPRRSTLATSILPEALRMATFELVWKTIDDSYWDRTFGGVDWQAVRAKYMPEARATGRSDEYHQLLDRMVGELRRSHFKVTPPEETLGLQSRAGDFKNGTIGLDLRWIDSQLVAVDVEEDSPAYAAGIRRGFAVVKIDGKTPDELRAEYIRKNPGFRLKEEIVRVRAAGEASAGAPGTRVRLEVLDGDDKSRSIELVRKARPIARSLDFVSNRLSRDVGYIKFNLFFGDLLPKFESAVADLRDTKTLIIDLRGNPGGVGQLAAAIANSLAAKAGSLGRFDFRYETQPVSYQGRGDLAYKGRVILLVDEMSASTSEVFAGGLQEQGRVTVVGTPTAGAVLPSLVQLLPTGGALQYVVSNFRTSNGIALEGRGVIPDVTAKLTRAGLLNGRDAVLEQALAFVTSAKAGK